MSWWLQLILLTLVGAFIGYATNWLAIKMLFRPRKPVGLGRVKFQGVLPSRRHDLAVHIGKVVESELVSHRDVSKILKSEDFQKRISEACGSKIELFIKEKFYSINPILSSVVPFEFIAERLKGLVVNQIAGMLPGLVEEFVENLENVVQFRKIVTERIEGFEMEKLEEIVLGIARKELRHIEVLGGLLGFFIGFAQFIIIRLA